MCVDLKIGFGNTRTAAPEYMQPLFPASHLRATRTIFFTTGTVHHKGHEGRKGSFELAEDLSNLTAGNWRLDTGNCFTASPAAG